MRQILKKAGYYLGSVMLISQMVLYPVLGEETEEEGETTILNLEDADQMIYQGQEYEVTGVETTVTKEKPVIIVLDPGHDSRHVGARGNGLKEEEITLDIANYCKEELETYENVVVYMTRSDGSCLDSQSNNLCLKARSTYAGSVGADLLVSIHADASNSASSKGAVAIVAGQSGYRDDISQITRDAGSMILSELTKVGLSSRGLYIRWSDSSGEEFRYPNGARADWYSITRNCMRANVPGIIVEHGFVTNAEDAARFLTNDASRKELGVADATGIAKYFGLTKKFNNVDACITTDDPTEYYTEDTKDIAGFIRNLYVSCLDRNPKYTEVSYWLEYVMNNNPTGGELANLFVFSKEFTMKELSDEEYVEKLYEIYLTRESDPVGKQTWTELLAEGETRERIAQGFEGSDEFYALCLTYGIAERDASTMNSRLYTRLTEFVSEYYVGFLDREPEEEGLEYWTTKLVKGGTASELVKGFVFSTEFMNKDLDQDEFVECLYNIFLGRESEEAGKQYWVDRLPTMSISEKEAVIRGFLYSTEYANHCKSYGIEVGSL